jgi:hypothetical protein
MDGWKERDGEIDGREREREKEGQMKEGCDLWHESGPKCDARPLLGQVAHGPSFLQPTLPAAGRRLPCLFFGAVEQDACPWAV